MTCTITFQPEFFTPAPNVLNNKEHFQYKTILDGIDCILKSSALDLLFAKDYLDAVIERGQAAGIERKPTAKRISFLTEHAVRAYRCMILKNLLQKPYRELSILIADSVLLQNFCHIPNLNNEVQVPSKSSLQRFSRLFSEEFLRGQVIRLIHQASHKESVLGLAAAIDTKDVFVDATCMKADIHFPVDWVLLKDCMMTILKAILVIRKHGLKYRIKDPKRFISQLNAQCMSITSIAGKPGAKKDRKKKFRQLRDLGTTIRTHGCNYISELESRWESSTDLTEGQKVVIIKRLEDMVALIPKAIEQAGKRILQNMPPENKEKILSAYHEDVNVLKRGKAGADCEFGNPLFIAEQQDGLIVDWKLYRTDVKEPQSTPESIKRMIDEYDFTIGSVTGDRGCHSAANDSMLTQREIFSGLASRKPLEMAEKMKDPKFRALQKRRAQTEGRIGILKNCFLDGSLYERTFDDKELAVTWAVFTHNLWGLARILKKDLLEKAA